MSEREGAATPMSEMETQAAADDDMDSMRMRLQKLEAAHAHALYLLREKDMLLRDQTGRLRDVEKDFKVVHTKYQKMKDAQRKLFWEDLPMEIDALCDLPMHHVGVEHVPAPPQDEEEEDDDDGDDIGVASPKVTRPGGFDEDGLAATHGVSGSVGRFALGRIIGKGGQAIV